jgi:outer membrane protein
MQAFRSALAAAALLGMPLTAAADIVGFSFGAYGWQASPEGFVEDTDGTLGASTRADVENDLGLDEETFGVIWAAIEHPVPLLPNLKLQYTPLKFEGSGEVDSEFTFQGQTFAVNEEVDSRLDLAQFDAIFYYEILDGTFNLDIGLNIKVLDGEAVVTPRSTGVPERQELSAPVPMLYLNAVVELPAGFRLGLEGSGIGYSGNRLTDLKALLGWEYAVVSLEAGYRVQQMVLDDIDGINADVKVGGPFLGASVDF